MCWGDVINLLRRDGYQVTAAQIRWAISSGKVARPPLDASLRFNFSDENVAELKKAFDARLVAGAKR